MRKPPPALTKQEAEALRAKADEWLGYAVKGERFVYYRGDFPTMCKAAVYLLNAKERDARTAAIKKAKETGDKSLHPGPVADPYKACRKTMKTLMQHMESMERKGLVKLRTIVEPGSGVQNYQAEMLVQRNGLKAVRERQQELTWGEKKARP